MVGRGKCRKERNNIMSENKKSVAGLLETKRDDSMWQKYIVNNAPLIMAIFANFVVVVSDIRVYDVIYTLTLSWWKALGASLACAIPFMIWEIAWSYNHTTDSWRTVSLLMAGFAFGTSIILGVADYIGVSGMYTDYLLGGVVIATGIHTVIGFLYYYNDPDVARSRRKSQALGKMQDQELNAEVAKSLLENGRTVLSVIGQLEKEYDPEDVEKVLAILSGGRIDKPSRGKQGYKPANSYATETPKQELAKKENPQNRQS